MKKILCICLSSTIQRSVTFEKVQLEHVNRSEHYVEHASGKAVNSARVLNQLEKGCVKTICPLGENNAQQFLKLAELDELDISYVTIPGSTRICWTLLDRTAGTTTELVVGEPIVQISQQPEVKLLKLLVETLPSVDGVLLAGSRPNIWSKDLYAAIAGMTKDAGKIFLADYIGDDLQLTLKSVTPDIIKINDEEFEKTFGFESVNLKTAITEKSRELQNMIVVTRGCDSTYAAKNGEFFECPAEVVKPVNTTACGDSFNAGFLHEYLNNGDFMKALQKGTWAAARNAESEIPGSINR